MSILTERKKWRRNPTPQRATFMERSFLTEREQANVRRAMAALRRRYTSLAKLAEALGVSPSALTKARQPSRRQTPKLALMAARLAGATFDEIVTGAWPKLIVCPRCDGTGHVTA